MVGSLINNLYSSSKQPLPQVGMGATELMFTDRNAYTIIEIINDKTIIVQRDDVKRVDKNGMSDSQEYVYISNPDNAVYEVTLRKNGKWITKGQNAKHGTSWLIGHRMEYYDYSF
jgi:hypothetical protein